ncbi:hypothetical protein A9K69_01470 [Stenotrophomonas maltophilia]|nr:hypothetical protein A9K69_01470 [Stenotrophomonas maltophilia]
MRLAGCPNYRLRKRFNEAVRLSFENGKETKGVFRLLGYTFEQLKSHLERQFLPGMNWDNRSDWHIDHIVPLASFTITSADSRDFHRAWALSNLRPIWSKDNLRKHARRIYLI